MTSGHPNQNTCPKVNNLSTDSLRKWLRDTYADCDAATVAVNEEAHVVVANDRAQKLLSVEADDAISDLDVGNGSTFGDVINDLLDQDLSLHLWHGPIDSAHPGHVEVQLTRLPSPTPLILCQFRPLETSNDDRGTRLVTDLTDLPHEHDSLDGVGQAMVDTIYRHLDTAVVARWFERGEMTKTWRAGNPEICTRLGESTASTVGPPGDSLNCFADEEADAAILSFEIAEDCAAVISIAVDSDLPPVARCSPFWTCLAATSKTSLQSARLLDLNRQERRRLHTVLEHMPIAVMLFDTEGRVLDLNLRARAMAGRRTWERIDAEENPYDVRDTTGKLLPREQWPLLRAVERGICCEEEEYIIDFGDCQRTISITVLPITDANDGVTSYLATGRDVTQRSEEDQRKEEFLSVASHELRGPLTPLAGFVQLSRQRAESGEPVDVEVLKRAEYQVRRLQQLIDGLLDRTRLETGKLPVHQKRVEMPELIRRIMHPWLEGPHGERIQLTLPDEMLEADVDPARFDQVLTNVVDNAIKHGRCDGSVYVRLHGEGDCLVVTVRDEGDGMPREIVDRVFERYFQLRSADSSGTGLGLYIARQIVEDHDGTIAIDSSRGQPTTVTIRLPMA